MHSSWSGIRSFSRILALERRSIYMSSIYRPVNVTPPNKSVKSRQKTPKDKEILSKSLRLFVDNGLIRLSSCFGAYHLLPMAMKAMEKLIKLVDYHMSQANCQKIQMPTLTSASLWKVSGRLDDDNRSPELLRVVDRHSKEFLLSPTHEEAICDLVGRSGQVTYRQLPLRLYQITDKFRDEMKPRFGLMRARQFIMKDLYTYDADMEAAKSTYNEINQIYQRLLNALDLQWVQAQGATGTIGGLMSDEFHVISDVGEDHLLHCSSCNKSFNHELTNLIEATASATGTGSVVVSHDSEMPKCINCSSENLSSSTSIEVAHSFLLSTKYTKPLNTSYLTENNDKVKMEMGCYGVGISRLLAACVEVKSSEEEIRWPVRIAPYLVSILPPKQGSKEDPMGSPISSKLYDTLRKFLPNDVIFDDRTNQTIGKRLQENKKLGIPYVIVCGKSMHDPLGPFLELHDVNAGKVTLEHSDNIAKFLYDVKSGITL